MGTNTTCFQCALTLPIHAFHGSMQEMDWSVTGFKTVESRPTDLEPVEVLDCVKEESLGTRVFGVEGNQTQREQGQKKKVKWKKNKQCHAKSPYSYLAMITHEVLLFQVK